MKCNNNYHKRKVSITKEQTSYFCYNASNMTTFALIARSNINNDPEKAIYIIMIRKKSLHKIKMIPSFIITIIITIILLRITIK